MSGGRIGLFGSGNGGWPETRWIVGLAGSSTAAGIVWAEPDDGEESSVCVIRGG